MALRFGWREAFVCVGVFACWRAAQRQIARPPAFRPEQQPPPEQPPQLSAALSVEPVSNGGGGGATGAATAASGDTGVGRGAATGSGARGAGGSATAGSTTATGRGSSKAPRVVPQAAPAYPRAEPQAAPAYSERAADAVLVALNKHVYRFVDERNYSCPAMRGAPCMFTTLESKFGRADAIIDVLKDPRKVRPLDFRTRRGQLRGVIISEQDRAKQGNGAFKSNGYDFEVGYNRRDSQIWRPFMCNELSRKTNVTIAETLLRGPPAAADPAAKTGVLAAWVSNCVQWRMDYLRELRKVAPRPSRSPDLRRPPSTSADIHRPLPTSADLRWRRKGGAARLVRQVPAEQQELR